MTDRRDALTGILSMLSLATTLPAPNSTEGWPETMFTLESGKTTHEKFGVVTVFFDGPTGECRSMVAGTLLLNPGMEPHPPHQHPEEEFVLVTEGRGEIVVNGQTLPAGPGALMFSHSNKLHGIKNTGSVPMRFYYFKWLGKA